MSVQIVKNVPHMVRNSWMKNGRVKFVLTAIGIFLSYLCVGVMQERIMKGRYGTVVNDDNTIGEKYEYANTLVEVHITFGLICVRIWTFLWPPKQDTTPLGYYLIAASANVVSMITGYTALRWVSYPTQTVFKSCKPIAIMLISLVVCRRYTIQKYICVILMVIGVIVFKLNEPRESEAPEVSAVKSEGKAFDLSVFLAGNHQLLGISLLVLSLSMDGTLGVIQDKIQAAHKPTSQQMLLSMSALGSGIMFVVLITTGELVQVYEFAHRHPELLWQMTTFGFASAAGQMCIYTMVASFGSLANSVTTTVRKFFSVVFSIVFFSHPSTLIQWTGAALVFSTLFADAFFSKKKKANNANAEIPEEPPYKVDDKTKPNSPPQVGLELV